MTAMNFLTTIPASALISILLSDVICGSIKINVSSGKKKRPLAEQGLIASIPV
jgi:hypothetical protein